MADNQTYEEHFAPMPIADLLDGKHLFVIPSFQRGYRWEEKQVKDLLEDIKQFANDDSQNSSNSYFLQPVVVKATKYQDKDAWEVLDGQQRLTTMLLILKELLRGNMTSNDIGKYKPLLYDIAYANRPQLNFDNPDASDNIDSYYLKEAILTINNWCSENEDFTELVRCLFYKSAKRQVKIIWYVIDDNSEEIVSINTFNRLNKGKIALTSSELIKALFIMDYDLRAKNDTLPAEQLSMEWNEMERRFQDDRFWYFISDDSHDTQTRIDVLFDFVTCRTDDTDSDYSYREFQKLYDFCRNQERNGTNVRFDREWSNDIHNMQDAWRQVRKTYDQLVAWYEDNMYYHYVGYLVAVGFSPMQIYDYLESKKREKKQESNEYEWTEDDTLRSLRQKIMERFKQDNRFIEKAAIDEFEYNQSELVRRILLLFNVECCRRRDNIRFAFDKYKKEQWDVEHVDSQNKTTLQEYEDRMRWLKNVKFILEMENTDASKKLAESCQDLIKDFTDNKKVNDKKYKEFYQQINQHYGANAIDCDTDVDSINKTKDYLSNLTLLDSSTNREYKDAPFAYKRYCIVKYDSLGDRFIPLCTRNLFLKYYTDSNKNSSYLDLLRWNSSDREGYLKAIHESVDPIFDSVNEGKEEENGQ